MPWDASIYLRHGGPRTRAAGDLLARVPLDAPRLVVDLGCGPGNSTRLLRERWPEARLVGVDSSPEMLAAARRAWSADERPAGDRRLGDDVEWLEARIEEWSPPEPPELIFSNAALHWVPEHARLLPRLLAALAPGGALAVQMPRRVPGQAFVEQLVALAREAPWAEHFAELPWGAPGPAPEDYHAWLAPHARAVDLWTTEYLHVLEGEDAVLEWTRGTALLPFLERLSPSERERFTALYRERLRRAYPRRPDGTTLFPFARLFLVAMR